MIWVTWKNNATSASPSPESISQVPEKISGIVPSTQSAILYIDYGTGDQASLLELSILHTCTAKLLTTKRNENQTRYAD